MRHEIALPVILIPRKTLIRVYIVLTLRNATHFFGRA